MLKITESMILNEKRNLLLLSVCGSILVLASTFVYGVGLWPDGVKYIAAARNMMSGNGYVIFHATPGPLIIWPPLFPTLLAFLSLIFNTDPLFISPIVNAVIFGLIVYSSGILASRFLSSNLVVILGVIAILVSTPLIGTSVWVSSEPLFIILTLAAFIYGHKYLIKGDLNTLFMFSVAVGLAPITRYAGLILILYGAVIIAYKNYKGTECKKTKIKHSLLFLFISTFPIGIWVIRNYSVSGSLFGTHTSSIFTLQQNLVSTLYTLLSWYLPHKLFIIYPVYPKLYSLIFLFLAIGFFIGVCKKIIDWNKAKVIPTQINLFMLFLLIYIPFLVLTSTLIAIDSIGDRFLAPIYVPGTLILLYVAEKLVKSFKDKLFPKFFTGLIAICVCFWLIYPINKTVHAVANYMIKGIGYNDLSWKESATIQSLLPLGISNRNAVYSNFPDALYILANLNARWSPFKHLDNSIDKVNDIEQLKNTWPPEDKAYLIWFNREGMNFLFSPNELQKIDNLKLIGRNNDGMVFLVSK